MLYSGASPNRSQGADCSTCGIVYNKTYCKYYAIHLNERSEICGFTWVSTVPTFLVAKTCLIESSISLDMSGWSLDTTSLNASGSDVANDSTCDTVAWWIRGFVGFRRRIIQGSTTPSIFAPNYVGDQTQLGAWLLWIITYVGIAEYVHKGNPKSSTTQLQSMCDAVSPCLLLLLQQWPTQSQRCQAITAWLWGAE